MTWRRIVQLTTALLVGGLLWAGAGAGTAGATENPDYTAPPPTTVVSTPQPATKVKTAVAVRPVRTRLAITGSDQTGTVVVAVTMIGLGAGALVLRRRHVAGS